MHHERIRVFVADDNLIVRQGVRALIEAAPDLEVVGEADDYDSLLSGVPAAEADVVVTDIQMPPDFQMEGIRAAKELRRLRPGLAAVILSQYDEPEYAFDLLGDGAAGLAYLLKNRVADRDQLARSIRIVSSGGSVIDPQVMAQVLHPVIGADLTSREDALLRMLAEGKPLKAMAASRRTTPGAVTDEIEALVVRLLRAADAGSAEPLRRMRAMLQRLVDLQEQSDVLSRLLPEGLANELRGKGVRAGETHDLEVTVLMSDVRGYSGIAERMDPAVLARQLHEHRAEMTRAVHAHAGTVMQFAGDAVLAVFGAPLPLGDHADRALRASREMHRRQHELNRRWAAAGRDVFGLGLALSTGRVAAAVLGSDERLEYSIVGDVVNLSQRLQQWASPGETVMSEPTYDALTTKPLAQKIDPQPVKGRAQPVGAYRLACSDR
jgi:class 3 adenylate cyclase/DNA-binding NarL/FixJ family response regulator